MLWENNSTIVVMLTKLREMGRVGHTNAISEGLKACAISKMNNVCCHFAPKGKMSPVLACRAFCQVPVLRG